MRTFLKAVSAVALLGHINHLRLILTLVSGSLRCSKAVNQALETSRAAKLVANQHFINNLTSNFFLGFADVGSNSTRPQSAPPRRGVKKQFFAVTLQR